MKKISKLFFIALSLVFSLQLSAQIKPDPNSVRPAAISELPSVNHSGSDQVNYVRFFEFYAPLTTLPTGSTLNDAVDLGEIIQSSQYFDGLGRPLQTVIRQGSGSAKDLVTFTVYDPYGRQVYQPMPYATNNSTNGAFQLAPSTDQHTFYKGDGSTVVGQHPDEDIFYGKTIFESSPLNRVEKVMAPGNSWTGNDNGVSSEWQSNTLADGVRKWTTGNVPTTTEVFREEELNVMITTDENGNHIKEYKNRRGLVVLKKVQETAAAGNGHTGWLNTYYLYDTHNRLQYVLPPRAVELISDNWAWSASEMNNLVFSYNYDDRNRMVNKTVPGSGRIDMVYDKLDRLVATQDANQRALSQWTFTKYDELSRPVLTGFLSSASNRTQLQAVLDSWTGNVNVKREGLSTANVLEGASITTSVRDTDINTYRSKSDGFVDYLPGFVSVTDDDFVTEREASLSHEYTYYEGYHDATFPLLSTASWEMNTVNYYDDYDFTTKDWNTDFNGFYSAGTENALPPAAHYNVRGMATGSKVRVLGDDTWLTTVMFYDDRGRVVQTQGENYLGGTDISTTQYDFAGRVLHTYTVHNNPDALVRTTTRILKRFTYDHAGRLLTVQQKLDDTGSLKTLVSHTYNALGELETKTLGNNLESLDYKYNVRGWLKSINGDYVANGMGGHFFGMDLSYDYGFDQNQLNGNIAGVTWRSQSSDKKRAYGFDYDKVNRLTEADYHQNDGALNAWSQATADFSTSYGYDANGNILSLMRKGLVAGTITTIDQLTYDYGNGFGLAAEGNQLERVRDTEGDLGQGDFKDGTNTGGDYDYDANGNMKDDLNKGITNITYNHLNLPVVVSFGSSKSITYTYDAAGIKLSKVVNDNGSLTTTDYAGGFIYENNALQHFAHEEGRVRTNNAGSLVFDYFIKDHLGNTRMTLTEEQSSTIYLATMESEYSAFEESLFINLAATRDSTVALANYTQDISTQEDKTARLNGNIASRRVGPAKLIAVSPGDSINMEVFAYFQGSYTNSGDVGQSNVVSAVAAAFGGSAVAAIGSEARSVYELFNTNAALAFVGSSGNSSLPKTYLNYILFDQDFNHVAHDYVQVGSAANTHQQLNLSQSINQGGYIYVWLSNESQTDFNVYFDDLRVTHTKGAILQEDHYYPFGMSISALSSSAPLSTPNRFKLSGNEEQTEFDLNLYDFNARMYDPVLGKFNSVDPMADQRGWLTPYNYVQNNPLARIDPSGMLDVYGLDKDSGEISLIEETDDETDELVDNETGETIVDKVDKGLLKDGLNIKEDGLETSNVNGGTRLAVNLSMHISTEIGGVVYQNNEGGQLLEIRPYKGQTLNRNDEGKVTQMNAAFSLQLSPTFTSKDGSFTGSPIRAFHTHPGHPDGVPSLGMPNPSAEDSEIATYNGHNGVFVPHYIYAAKTMTRNGVTSNVSITTPEKRPGWDGVFGPWTLRPRSWNK